MVQHRRPNVRFERLSPASVMNFTDELIDSALERFGSPLYLVDEHQLRTTFRQFQRAFASRRRTTVAWSYKTCPLNAVCRILHQEGAAAEIVSEYEWEMAQLLAVQGSDIFVNGPAKSRKLLNAAVQGSATIQLDGWQDIGSLVELLDASASQAKVALRIELDAGATERWNRFGFSLESGEALQALHQLARDSRFQVVGLHTHLGTCLTDPAVYRSAARQLAELVRQIRKTLHLEPEYVNLGGGFPAEGTQLPNKDGQSISSPNIADYADAIAAGFDEVSSLGQTSLDSAAGSPSFRLVLEPGRALIDRAVSLATTVLESRTTSSGEAMLVLDAGVHLLPAAHWYPLEFHAARRKANSPLHSTRLAGPLCMNTDILSSHALLPELATGDRLLIHPVGAYHRAQSWQFIAYRPATVLVTEDQSLELIERAETFEDWQSRMLMPEHLQ